ncbi:MULTISPECIES: alpha/beta hydrolase [unclassified Lysobacter]|uniref:esterase/lipase family protein n=1 Tax=unclassified Lysobacter TaxID=2635362 RepID=UPI001C247B35|nr:alpha/beta hydrolase [Lysobacter sp. MMG2]MBU8975506.1 alpha/beta hydrolase [Lysobacter sp. MMG2]
MTDPSDTRRVVLLHGLWMPRLSMHWVARRLRAEGYEPDFFGYATIAGGPDAALPRLAERLRGRPAHLLAHSLGGLVALSTLESHPDLPVARVVCLGSPLCGSAAAQTLAAQAWSAPYLGRSARLLRQGCPVWNGPAAIGMVAGRTPLGLGRYFGRFEGENDGTVAVAETRLPGLADHAVIPVSHTGLLYSPEVVRLAVGFFRDGRFPVRGSGGPIE